MNIGQRVHSKQTDNMPSVRRKTRHLFDRLLVLKVVCYSRVLLASLFSRTDTVILQLLRNLNVFKMERKRKLYLTSVNVSGILVYVCVGGDGS